jgi:choline kinase
MVKHALILAAGTGSRLNLNRPKGFINLYGNSLISYSIKALLKRGICPIIGTGYGARYYQALGFETRQNDVYETTGSLHTLRQMGDIRSDVLILESDILYDPIMLDAIIECPAPNVVLFGKGDPKDAVFAEVDSDGNLIHMSKKLPPNQNIAVGISKLSADTFARLIVKSYCILKKNPKEHYDYAYETLGDKFFILNAPGVFTEIDDQEQLEYAINYVYPRIDFN